MDVNDYQEDQDKLLDTNEYDKLTEVNSKIRDILDKITSIDNRFATIKNTVLK